MLGFNYLDYNNEYEVIYTLMSLKTIVILWDVFCNHTALSFCFLIKSNWFFFFQSLARVVYCV